MLYQQPAPLTVSYNSKLERCLELTQDAPRVVKPGHTQKGTLILAERKVENAQMANLNTHGATDAMEGGRES